MPSRLRESVRQNRPLAVATGLASLAYYAFHIIASRRLGVNGYGTVATLFSAVTFVNAISAIGATIIARFAADFHALGEHARLRRLFNVVTRYSGYLFVTGTLIALLLSGPLSTYLQIDSRIDVVLTAVLGGLTVALVLFRGLFQGTQAFTSFSYSFIIEQVGRAVIAALLVVIGFRIEGALLGSIVAASIATLYTYVTLRRSFAAAPARLRLDGRHLLITSSAIAVSTLSLATLSFFDLILAKHYLSPHDAGLYGFAILPGRALAAIAAFLPTWMLPISVERSARGASGSRLLITTLGMAAALGLFSTGVFYAFSKTIATLVAGPAFADAAPLIFPYGCAAALFSLTSIVVAYQIGQHRFTFVLPLFVTIVGEITVIALFHRTALEVVLTVLGANAVALLASLFGMTSSRREPEQVGEASSVT